ncbi:hypothetical protein VP01_1024g4 [Puccinia sorghi]|uniref:Uncharacterized protein n=1 Tax=Puccinia sorghi TaxID=27349 RepID=A0A0L6VUP6_9BASI|nr:hypothetical protein VP01_1024g4 [Puccinia sorghi]
MSFQNQSTPYNMLIKQESPAPPAFVSPAINQSANQHATSNSSTSDTTYNRFQNLEEENRRLKDDINSLKQLLQTVAINPNSNNTSNNNSNTSTPKNNKSTRKSLTPAQLKKEKDGANHDLDCVPLDHIGKKLLTSCYELARCLMNRQSATDAVPDPPTVHERNWIKGFFDVSDILPTDNAGSRIAQCKVVPIQGTSKIDNDYVQYVHATMRRWGIPRFTMDWEKHWDDRFNQIMCQFFIQVWKWGLTCTRFGLIAQHEASRINMDNHTLMAIYWQHAKSLRRYYKRSKKGENMLNIQLTTVSNQKSTARQLYLQEQGIHIRFTRFNISLAKTPFWRSAKATEFIEWIEKRRRTQKVPVVPKFKKIGGFGNRAALRPRRQPVPEIIDEKCAIPIGLPQDFYALEFLATLSFAEKKALHASPNLFDMIDHFDSIIPACEGNFHQYPNEAHIDYAAQDWPDSDGEDEIELIANDSVQVKIEEDQEML